MTGIEPDNSESRLRVLVLSMFLAPCKEVGGKRFSYLSRFLSDYCGEYHVVARKEREPYEDSTAFVGNVERTGMLPYWPPRKGGRLKWMLSRAWSQWICTVDKYIGWVLPASSAGIRLCREKDLGIVVVTVPLFSSIIAAVIVRAFTGTKLVIDYRDEWTNYRTRFPKPLGRLVCRWIERMAIRRSSAVVVCTDIMRKDFVAAFGDIAPDLIEIIYNGFTPASADRSVVNKDGKITMIYAGTFHGRRRLSVVAPALAELLKEGVISAESFCFSIYSRLQPVDLDLISELGIGDIVRVCEPVSYDEILAVMRRSDILFLPSGDEVPYAVPFKFFDYLSVGRPILAVASRQSTVGELMHQVDCGEFADYGETPAIVEALKTLLSGQKHYSYRGAERFHWENAARQYIDLLERVDESPR